MSSVESIRNEEFECLQEAAHEGWVTCRNCGNRIEPDLDKCFCGWLNPVLSAGFI